MESISLTPQQRKDLIIEMKRERKPSRRLRMHIVLLTSDGRSPTEIARVLFCSRTTVYAIASRVAASVLAGRRRLKTGWRLLSLPAPTSCSIWRFSDRVLVNRSFKPIVKRTGLPPIAFKDLRHTAASLLFKLGIHPKQVQEMLGHKDFRLTLNTYSHISPDMQDTVVNAMNTALNRSQKQQSTWPASPKP